MKAVTIAEEAIVAMQHLSERKERQGIWVHAIKEFLNLIEITKGKENKAFCAIQLYKILDYMTDNFKSDLLYHKKFYMTIKRRSFELIDELDQGVVISGTIYQEAKRLFSKVYESLSQDEVQDEPARKKQKISC
jgi:hypothetical protein